MTNMDTDQVFWQFGVTLATVCVPFFLLIGFLNTDSGYRLWVEKTKQLWHWMRPKPKPKDDDEDFELNPVSRTLTVEEGMRMRLGEGVGMRRQSSQQDQRNSHPNIRKMVEAMGEGRQSGLVRMGTVSFEGATAPINTDGSDERRTSQADKKEDDAMTATTATTTTKDMIIDVKDE
jgi:hypothetical protein